MIQLSAIVIRPLRVVEDLVDQTGIYQTPQEVYDEYLNRQFAA
ncbi:MAG: hypothetical protein ACRDQ4_27280 [Pseudonocardiaceae bacterium]